MIVFLRELCKLVSTLRLWVIPLFMVLSTVLWAQNDPEFQLYLRSGERVPEKTIERIHAKKSRSIDDVEYKIIQFDAIPAENTINELKQLGIELLDYIPNNAYIASINNSSAIDISTQKRMGIRTFVAIQKEDKTDYTLLVHNVEDYPSWAVDVASETIELIVSIYDNYPLETAESRLKALSTSVVKHPTLKAFDVIIPINKLDELANTAFVSYIEPVPSPPVDENYTARDLHRSKVLDSDLDAGRKYNGSGVAVSVGDGGRVEFHTDFTGRFNSPTTSGDLSSHATHVAGTIVGGGILNPYNTGHAPGATLFTYNQYQDISNMATIYNSNSIRITNHSLGGTCNAGYTSQARTADIQVRTYPSLIHVFSAGNSGRENCGQYATNWGNITGGYKMAKNVIAVGNLSRLDVISSSSSRGPTPDGRIKPDVCAKGSSVVSTEQGNTYSTKSGTSMAAPSTAGLIAQLFHAFKEIKGQEPKAGLLKAIVMNTAEDLGNPGPDYIHGYGRINGLKAVKCIENTRYVTSTISNNGNNTHTINVPQNVRELKVLLYWTDREAATLTSKDLVNDLDMTLRNPANTTFQPWTLNPNNVNADAVRGVERRNNAEQITVNNPASGNYTVNVNGFQVPFGPQEYFVIYEYIMDDIVVSHPAGGEGFRNGSSEIIRWDAYGNSGNFTVQYSTNNGNTWTALSTTVPGDRRYYTWTVPNVVTGTALVRVSRSGISGQSEATFSIINIPTNLQVDWVCANNFQLSWNAVTGATGYEVFMLGDRFMESVGQTSTTSMVITSPSNRAEWISVRALGTNNLKGQRANAIRKTTGVSGCVAQLSASITNPTNGTTFTGNEDVTITATASPTTGRTITRIDFYVDDVLVGSDNTAPYTLNVGKLQVGTRTLKVIAFETGGASVTSSNISIQITSFIFPVIVSTTNTTQYCEGGNVILRADGQSLTGATYQWYRNGNTITNANSREYQVNQEGLYKVRVLIDGAFEESTEVEVKQAETLPAPYVSNTTRCGSGEVSLIVNSLQNKKTVWYKNNALFQEAMSITDNITATTSYTVRQFTSSELVKVGPSDNTFGNGGNHAGGFFLQFDVAKPITIKSVLVYAEGAKNRTFVLRDAQANIIESKVINVPNGSSRVELNLNVPVGENYQIGVATGADLYRNDTSVDFPYEIEDLITIKTGMRPNGELLAEFYYYLYDWEVQETLPECPGELATVTATILNVPNPTLENKTICTAGDEVELNILNATADVISTWYTNSSKNQTINVGESYVFNPMVNTTLYVENTIDRPLYTGMVNNTGEGANHAGNFYLLFDAQKAFVLKSAVVYAQGDGNRTLILRNAAREQIASKTVFIPNGQSRVDLDFEVPAGQDLSIGFGAGSNLYRNNGEIPYPFVVDGILEIKSGMRPEGDLLPDFYYYLYDMEIIDLSSPCASNLSEVSVTIEVCTSTDSWVNKGFEIFPNPTSDRVQLSIPNDVVVTNIAVINAKGVTLQHTTQKMNEIDLSGYAAGIYIIEITSDDQVYKQKLIVK